MAVGPLVTPRYTVASTVRLPPELRADLNRLAEWLRAFAQDLGLQVREIRVSRWRSQEVPQNRETVVDVWVRGDEAAALRLWTAAGDYLGKLPTASSSLAKAPLTVDVHWR